MKEVYFKSFKGLNTEERISAFADLVKQVGMPMVKPEDSTAVKIHFGEPGCTTYVKPHFIKVAVDHAKSIGAKPYLTDSNTLYIGRRSNGKDHREVAALHGFGEDVMGCPIVIADGDDSTDVFEKKIDLHYFKSIKYGIAAEKSDSLIVISHFKGHLLFGFGGAIKNVGMGFGSRSAKQMMHADVRPELRREKCISCGECTEVCPADSIKLIEGYPLVDYDLCEGCAECIIHCPEGALQIQWDGSVQSCMEKTTETCYAILEKKLDKVIFFNFIIDVTPDCDCFPESDTPLIGDVGVVASTDPIAIDAASLDLVNAEHGRKDSKLKSGFNPGEDKFMGLRPEVDGRIALRYGEKIGLGKKDYKLVEL